MAISFFQQGDPKPGDDSPISVPGNASSGSGVKIAILFGAMLALVGATGYLYYQLGQLRTELSETREALGAKIAEIHETSNVSTQTSRRSVEALKSDVDRVRSQAAQLSGQAKIEATKHADELAARLEKAQQDEAQKVTAVTAEVSQVKESAAATTLATNTKIGEVSTEVGAVKTDVAATRSELEKTIADLKSTRGDLGVQSGLIATNGKELAALRALGERNYTEFKIARAKAAQKIGDVAVRLTKTDPKRNRYTIELVADDKTVEKKDRTINEPVQFLLSKATQPYELVVNDVKKDVISGYLAAPKVQQTRN
jgi:chromosome segregation ATPase